MTDLDVYVLLPAPALDARPLPTSVLPPTRSASVSHGIRVDDSKLRRLSVDTLALEPRSPPARVRMSKRPTTSGGRPGRQPLGWEGDEVVRLLRRSGLKGAPAYRNNANGSDRC